MERRAVLLGLVVASLANISCITATNRLSNATSAFNSCDATSLNVHCLCRAYDRDGGAEKGKSFEKGDCYEKDDCFEKGNCFVSHKSFGQDKSFGHRCGLAQTESHFEMRTRTGQELRTQMRTRTDRTRTSDTPVSGSEIIFYRFPEGCCHF